VNQEAWPTPQESPREPLPRVEDLPVAEQGYEQDSVRAAFDSFYRHAAQLDAALRTLEAVDSFQRQASALRADIRTLRTAGWSQQPWSATPTYGYAGRGPREGISPAVWRIAGEAAFLIAVAVALGVAKLSWWLIVVVMAVAWVLVGLLEWAAARDRFTAPRAVAEPPHPVVDIAPAADRMEEDPQGWAAYEAAPASSDAMTMIGASPALDEQASPVEEVRSTEDASEPDTSGEHDAAAPDEPEPPVEAAVADAEAEPQPDADSAPEDEPEPLPAAEAEPEPEPEPAAPAAHEPELTPEAQEPKRHWWQRRREEEPPVDLDPAPFTPRHVRVLAGDEYDVRDDSSIDPWEAGFDDAEPEAEHPPAVDDEGVLEPDEDTDDAAAVVAERDDAERRRFRRR